jgi:hypothetical protein
MIVRILQRSKDLSEKHTKGNRNKWIEYKSSPIERAVDHTESFKNKKTLEVDGINIEWKSTRLFHYI